MKFRSHLVVFIVLFVSVSTASFPQEKQIPKSKDRPTENSEREDTAPQLPAMEKILSGMDQEKFKENNKLPLELSNPEEFLARTGRGDREAQFRNTFPSHATRGEEEQYGSKRIALLRAGYGLYYSPYVEGWLGKSFALGDVNAHVVFDKSSGYVSRADYSRFGFEGWGGGYLPADLNKFIARSRVEGGFHFLANDYNLFADKIAPAARRFMFDRSRRDIRYEAGIFSRKNESADYEFRIGALHTLLWENQTEPDSGRTTQNHLFESTYFLEATFRQKTDLVPILYFGQLYVSDNTGAKNGSNPLFGKIGASAFYDIDNDFRISADLRFYLFRGSQESTSGWLGGAMKGSYSFEKDFNAFAEISREVRRVTYASFLDVNPYIALNAALEHERIPIRICGGIEYDNRLELNGRLTLSYEQATSYPIFVSEKNPYAQQWMIDYSGTTSLYRFEGEVAYQPMDDDEVFGNLKINLSSNTERRGHIPYVPTFEAGSMFRHRFPFMLETSISLQWIGERVAEASTLPSVLVLSVTAEYRFHQYLGAFLTVKNLTAQKYESWPGYSAPPFFPMIGITARF